MYAGDWARTGVRVSLVKTGNDNSCSRYVTLEMVNEDRFVRNPYAESLAVIVNVSDRALGLCASVHAPQSVLNSVKATYGSASALCTLS